MRDFYFLFLQSVFLHEMVMQDVISDEFRSLPFP